MKVFVVVENDSIWNNHIPARETSGAYSTRERARARIAYLAKLEGPGGWHVEEWGVDDTPTSDQEAELTE